MRSAIETIAAQQLDIVLSAPSQPAVFFPMMAKLAPLHIVVLEPNWTDGFPESDYYMSWRPAEPPQPGAFYRTKVAYLDHPPYWIDDRYDHEVHMTEEQRQDFLARLVGTTPDQRVYLCPSTPPKLHPRMDEIILRILDRDPQAVFVFLRGEFPPASNLHIRWRNRMGRRCERIRFLNTLERSDAHTLLHAVDCTIDSYPIGGMSSSFDGSILGIPTATFPADVPFGRWLSSIYSHIGVTGLTAHSAGEYVELAVRLAQDKAWRRQKSAEIRSKSRIFVESRASAAEVQQFLLSAWERHCAGLPAANWISGQWIH
jgi:predicted O-linked N-acetylglucosamine transferase (SPINDLY family)